METIRPDHTNFFKCLQNSFIQKKWDPRESNVTLQLWLYDDHKTQWGVKINRQYVSFRQNEEENGRGKDQQKRWWVDENEWNETCCVYYETIKGEVKRSLNEEVVEKLVDSEKLDVLGRHT
jgi:hypothetical protein